MGHGKGMKPPPSYPPEPPEPQINGLSVMVPLETEVICRHREMVTGVEFSAPDKQVTVLMDARRGPWQERLKLSPQTSVHWADVRTVDIKELSVLPWRITYRLTYGDPWYKDVPGHRHYFGLQAYRPEMDWERQASAVTLRAAVLLCVLGGIGLRCVSGLMALLFHCPVSKSALDRWVGECAEQLPAQGEMVRRLNADKPITQGHLDELYARGQKPKRYTLVLKDEHGRLLAARALADRSAQEVAKFLREVKGWGLKFTAFYVDGCEAYREAIAEVFPDELIPYDYFHIIKALWKKLRQAVLERRREVKEQAEEAPQSASQNLTDRLYRNWMLGLAQRIGENRGLFFRKQKDLSEEELSALERLCEQESLLDKVRSFVGKVWTLFEDSQSEGEARQSLEELQARPEAQRPGPFRQAVEFLEGRFEDMVTYLRRPDLVQRNSLAESGMRCLRRLEQGHDGFGGAEGLDRYLRIYQAIRYCHWSVHRWGGGLGLEPGPLSPPLVPPGPRGS